MNEDKKLDFSQHGSYYVSYTYTVGEGSGSIDLTHFLNELHMRSLEYIDEAVDMSDLSDAKEIIDWIKEKL